MAAVIEFGLTAADGLRLHGQGWIPEQACGVMAVVHGIAEHGGRYAWLAARANARGIGVATVDLRGHGRSPGERSYVEGFDDYLLDVDALWVKAGELAAGRPLFLMGHSMGGAIALRWAAQRRQSMAGLILSSAALKIGGDVPRLLVALAPLLSRWLPHMRGTRLDPSLISRDPAQVAAYVNDPLVSLKAPPARTGAELLAAMEANRAAAAGFNLPLYLFHGDSDRLTDPQGSREIHAAWGGADKALRLWPGSRHETLNDLDRESVATELLDWVRAHAGSGGAE
ncbi:alpha/beta hydrolase [Sulfuritalea sp.]|uniref:alpha/beta hydrolase n=1 Tax=Sulfuritalea sp. TaxID=2480090 RepID=UPI001AC1943F|nr:alpha/beta hydrolase [Sulfuritalea sp.]MBN8474306.1 lysophospholipase [Sulfuritalea sp.]